MGHPAHLVVPALNEIRECFTTEADRKALRYEALVEDYVRWSQTVLVQKKQPRAQTS